jgi:hypothetical protein
MKWRLTQWIGGSPGAVFKVVLAEVYKKQKIAACDSFYS